MNKLQSRSVCGKLVDKVPGGERRRLAVERERKAALWRVDGDGLKFVRFLPTPLQVGMHNEARRTLIPLEDKRNFLEVSVDIIEQLICSLPRTMTFAIKPGIA